MWQELACAIRVESELETTQSKFPACWKKRGVGQRKPYVSHNNSVLRAIPCETLVWVDAFVYVCMYPPAEQVCISSNASGTCRHVRGVLCLTCILVECNTVVLALNC